MLNECRSRRSQRGFSLVESVVVVGMTAVISAVAVPMMGNTLGFYKLSGDARSVSNATAVAKLRAASDFSQTRIYVDLAANSFHMETWQKTGTPGWVWEGGATALNTRDSFGFGVVTAAPPNTQASIAQAPQCRNNAGNAIGNTACIVFNSRGIPVDSSGSPTALDAVYLTDGTAVYGVTVAATGLIRMWRTGPQATPSWGLQ